MDTPWPRNGRNQRKTALQMVKLKAIRQLPRLQVHWAQGDRCLASRDGRMFASADRGLTWNLYSRLPVSVCRNWALRSSLYSRFVRGGVHGIWPFQSEGVDGWIVAAERALFVLRGNRLPIEPLMQVTRGRRPLRKGLCVLGDRIFWGEYWSNPRREEVRIFCHDLAMGKTDVFHQFGPGRVRHVHAIQPDPDTESLWVAVGDDDAECALWIFDTRSGNPHKISGGSQRWRAASLAFRSDAVYWGTDHPSGTNHIWRLDRRSGCATSLGEVIGPVYYNVNLNDCIIFGTTVERGEGQQDGYARLYACDGAGSTEEIFRMKKDRWHPILFGYGVFEFAEQPDGGNQFWVATRGLRGGLRSILFQVSGQ